MTDTSIIEIGDVKTLRELVSKSQIAMNGLDEQVANWRTEIATKRVQLDILDQEQQESEEQATRSESLVREQQAKLDQARATASIAKDTAAAGATQERVQTLQTEVAGLEQQAKDARAAHTKLIKNATQKRTALLKEIEEAEATIETVQQTRGDFSHAYREAHVQLGQALYEEKLTVFKQLAQRQEELELEIAGVQLARMNAQDDIEELAEWPSLAATLSARFIPKAQKPQTATSKALKAYLKWLEALEENGDALASTPLAPALEFQVNMLSMERPAARQILTGHARERNAILSQKRAHVRDWLDGHEGNVKAGLIPIV